MKTVSFLASGRGSNFETIAKKIKKKKIKNAKLGILLTDNPQAGAITIAKKLGMEIKIVDFEKYRGRRAEFDKEVLSILKQNNPDLLVAAGYMKIIAKDTVDAFNGRIINIHPSLLPAFPGLHAQKQAWEYGVRISGCTVHFIDSGLDTGPIILQKSVIIKPEYKLSQVQKLILEKEHKAYPEAVALFCADRLKIAGRRVIIK